MLAVFSTSLFLKGIIQVGDTTINQESSQNYNGYFNTKDENRLLNAGFDFIQYIDDSAFTGYSLYVCDLYCETTLNIFLVLQNRIY